MNVTIPETAKHLGITENAVRQRIKRQKLKSFKKDGRVFVILDQTDIAETSQDQDTTSQQDQSAINALEALVKAHAEEISHLKGQIETAKDDKLAEIARLGRQLDAKDRQIEAALTVSMAQRALEAPKASLWERLVGKR